jgi:hypothetical protein
VDSAVVKVEFAANGPSLPKVRKIRRFYSFFGRGLVHSGGSCGSCEKLLSMYDY